jgi:hypothetical protein
MWDVEFNPREARYFAEQLSTRSADLRRLNSAILNGIMGTGSTWQDEKFRRFRSQYDAHCVLLQRFAERSERFAEHLRQKASDIERYLDRSY